MVLVRRYDPEGAHTEQTVDGAITLGRATDNTIQLPGLLVALHHLRLTPSGGLRLKLESLSAVGVTVNGLPGQREAELLPADELQLGGHRIRLGLDDSGAGLMLEIHERDTSASAAHATALASLADAGWGMRRPALIGAALVAVIALLVPLVLRAVSAPAWLGDWVPSDRQWSSGRISDAHRHFGNQCSSCHDTVFVRVRDEACLTCHQGIAHHGDSAEHMAAAGLDQRRCASCHFEHGDTHAVLPRHSGICVDCHVDPDRFPGLENSGAVEDFGADHPPFRVSVTAWQDGAPVLQRALLDTDSRDASGLIYPHDLHLDAKGVRGPDGVEVLACKDCHRPGPGEVGFENLRFERDCQRCHQLDVTVGGLPFRLPHGDSEAVRALLQSAVGMPTVPQPALETGEEDRRRPGTRAERGDGGSTLDQVDEVFERRVCAKCHDVQKTEGVPASVSGPVLRKTWMPMARFTHAPHQWVSCDACHAATASSDSNELLLPQIDSCRTCHGGVGSDVKIQSTCIDCHRFHQSRSLSMSKLSGKLAHAQTSEREQ